MEFRAVCRLNEIEEGQGATFFVEERRIALFRVDDEWYAIEDECPHAGASLARGYLEDGVVSCRIHDWRFRIADGKYLDEDQPNCDRATFRTRVVGDQVEVEC